MGVLETNGNEQVMNGKLWKHAVSQGSYSMLQCTLSAGSAAEY